MPKRGKGRSRFESLPVHSGGPKDSFPVGASVALTDGRLYVTISDARLKKGSQILDCTAWLVAPKLATLFAEAVPRMVANRNTSRTRYQAIAELKDGFFAYCGGLSNAEALDVSDVTQELINAFVDSMKAAKCADGKNKYKLGTMRHRTSALRSAIKVLVDTGRLPAGLTVPELEGKEDNPTPPLERDLYGRFLAHCRRDCLSRMTEVEKALDDIAELRGMPANQRPRGQQLAKALITAFDSYVVLPERKELQRIDNRTFEALEGVGYTGARRVAHPMAQDLTPFVYFLAGATLFNAQPLMEIKLSEILEVRILGVARLSLHPYKTRAHQHQHRSFAVTSEPDNPQNMIRFIKRWTERARSEASADVRDALFIYVPRNRKAESIVRPLYDRQLGMSREFSNHSAKYCKKAGFPNIGTRALRATGADIADEIFEGDPVEVEALLGHVPQNIRNPSYRSKQSRERDEEKLAGGMVERERWVSSGGRVDARMESADRNRTAATPGFRCLDLFNSPMPGERRGRACSAYGFCPLCPLAEPDPSAALAVARLLQLRERLNEARERFGTAVWKRRFKPVADRIDQYWLPLLATNEVLDAASRLDLNPIPHVE